ncbi:hypothetical protein AAVH_33467 [Aphelenchoides avenae]|nr:hypothetical protein AAVH_33467 [Aphelenchus avenae]
MAQATGSASAPKKKQFKETDRLFSLSSVTSPVVVRGDLLSSSAEEDEPKPSSSTANNGGVRWNNSPSPGPGPSGLVTTARGVEERDDPDFELDDQPGTSAGTSKQRGTKRPRRAHD